MKYWCLQRIHFWVGSTGYKNPCRRESMEARKTYQFENRKDPFPFHVANFPLMPVKPTPTVKPKVCVVAYLQCKEQLCRRREDGIKRVLAAHESRPV